MGFSHFSLAARSLTSCSSLVLAIHSVSEFNLSAKFLHLASAYRAFSRSLLSLRQGRLFRPIVSRLSNFKRCAERSRLKRTRTLKPHS